MRDELFELKRKFFLRLKGNDVVIITIALIAILVVMILFRLPQIIDAFYILRGSKSSLWGVVGLIVLAIFFSIGAVGAEWINSKDNVSHPLQKRVFHLILLLCFVVSVIVICGFVFKWLGW